MFDSCSQFAAENHSFYASKNSGNVITILFFHIEIQAFVFQTKLTDIVGRDLQKKEELVVEIKSLLEEKTPSKAAKLTAQLSPDELRELENGIKRIQSLVDFSIDRGLRLLVDAEYTYMNAGISLIALALMAQYNQQQNVWIGNTYQCYLKVNIISETSDQI